MNAPEFVQGEHAAPAVDERGDNDLADPWIEPSPSAPAVRGDAISTMEGFEARTIFVSTPPADRVENLEGQLAEARADQAEREAREQARRERIAQERAERERVLVEHIDDLRRRFDAIKDAEPVESAAYRTRSAARRFLQSLDPRALIGCGDPSLVELASIEVDIERALVDAEDDAPELVERVDALEAVIWSKLVEYATTTAGTATKYPLWSGTSKK